MENIQAIVATVNKLSSLDVDDPQVVALSERLASMLVTASSEDPDFLYEQLKRLHQAAEVPSKNYGRILAISAALGRAVQMSRRPQNAALRPKIANIVQKVAGLFAEVDTAEDLDKPLEQIEKAVHSLYGDQGKNSTYYFDRRGKGHHSK